MMLSRVGAWLGAAASVAAVVLAFLERVLGLPRWWWITAVALGVLLLSNSYSYALGLRDRREADRAAARRARHQAAAFYPDVASRSPAAGRPGASLTGVVGSDPETLLIGRVDPDTET